MLNVSQEVSYLGSISGWVIGFPLCQPPCIYPTSVDNYILIFITQ